VLSGMIEFHRCQNDNYADRIQQKLDDMVLAYKTVTHRDPESDAGKEPDTNLPYFDENGTKYSGKKEIETYLEELSRELEEQRSISGDACYIDPRTGEIC